MVSILGIPNLLSQGIPNLFNVRLAFMDSWHSRLKFAREYRRVKANALAKTIGVTPATISDWESGKTKKIEGDNLLNVCDALQICPRWLLFNKGLMLSINPKIQHLTMMLQNQPDYVVDEAIKNIASDIELLEKAKSSNENTGTQ